MKENGSGMAFRFAGHDGRNDNVYLENWFHSDMKNMAFVYVYPFYNDLITKGDLK